jgi:hypothetical protein
VDPADLLSGARYLIERGGAARPRQADLKRAVSSTYYALFHALARTCADMVIGARRSDRINSAWRQVYRSLEHGLAASQCANKTALVQFPQEIQDVAYLFLIMQKKRHEADYDPSFRTFKPEVLLDLAAVQSVIDLFMKSQAKDRRAFAALLLFRPRK